MFVPRLRGRILTLLGIMILATAAGTAGPLAGQQSGTSGPDALERHHPYLAELLDALETADALVLASLAADGAASEQAADARIYTRVVRDILATPGEEGSAEVEGGEGRGNLTEAVPARARSALRRATAFRRALLEVFADPDATAIYRDVRELVSDYLADGETAFPSDPKEAAITGESPADGAFGATHPNLHGLSWAGRWLRLAAFEPLIRYDTPERRRAGVLAVVARFWSMLEDPPETLPTQRPMAPTIAPALVDEYPDAAAILDNAGMFRDVVADALAGDDIGDRAAIVADALDRFQDRDFLRASWYDWNRMAILRGVGNQGGWAIDIVPRPERTEVDLDGDQEGHQVLPGMPVDMD